MAPSIGVSSVFDNLSTDLYRRANLFSSTPCFPFEKNHAGLLRASFSAAKGVDVCHYLKRSLRGQPLFVPSAIASPNSVLSEEAFKGLDSLKGSSSLVENKNYQFHGKNVEVNDGELDVSMLGLPEKLVESLQKRGIAHLFPIQRAVLVPALQGRDIIARAKTGTGKTLAFGIPVLKRLTEEDEGLRRRTCRLPRVLVLAPTRELAKQVDKEIKESAPYLDTACVYGGVSYTVQQNAITRGVDVIVGTPGRIIDLVNTGTLQLREVQYFILDEADRMLAVGFEEDVEFILQKLPPKRQNMLFSATMPGWVKTLAIKYLNNPLTIDLIGEEEEKLAEGIKLYAISSPSTSKRMILSDLIMVYAKGGKTIIFTQTKNDADEVSQSLTNSIASEALHGDISQHQRERTLNGFRQGKFTVLVATDVASRGLDIPNVDLIIHYELPNDPETFVHRSGRTGRAGKEGTAILMFTNNQRRTVKSIERDVGCRFDFISPPHINEVLNSSSEQVIATLQGVHSESISFFLPAAEKLLEEKGTVVLAAALAHLSGFSQPPSSRSLINHQQGWVTLQLTRESEFSRGFFSARSVTGFLSDMYPAAADEVGKIHLVADENIMGAVFDLPEEIAKELLNKELPRGSMLSKITKLPALQDDGPANDFYGRLFNNERGSHGDSRGGIRSRGGFRDNRTFRGSRSMLGRDDGSNDAFGHGGRNYRTGYDLSKSSRGSDDDWLMSGRKVSRSSFGNRERSFDRGCYKCGDTGHRALDCPNDGDY